MKTKKQMKRISLFMVAILAAGSLTAQTLEDYLQMAVENNPGIRARETEMQAALQKLPQAKSLPDPTVNASFFISPMMLPEGNQLGSISVMQMFPWPGTRAAMENEAARMAEVKQQDVQVAQNELALSVKNAWYPLLGLEAQIRIQKELLRVLEADKELAAFRFGQGQAPMVDVIRADMMIDEARTEIALLELKRKPMEAVFNRLLNRDDSQPVVLSGVLPEPRPEMTGWQDSLIAHNPALAVFDKQIEAAAAGEAVAEAMQKPMFGVGIQYMPFTRRKDYSVHELPPNTGQDMIMPMVSVTLPIWNKKYKAAVEERRLMQGSYASMKQDMQNELAAMYAMTVYESEKMAQMIALYNLQMIKTQQSIDLLLAAYSNSGQDFMEVLRMQQQLFRYRMEKVSAQTAYQLALAKMDYLTGK